MQRRMIHVLFILSLVVINIGCDQASKKIIRNTVRENEVIHLVNEHITVTNVENTGAFLSTGSSLPQAAKYILLSLLPLIVISMGLIYVLSKQELSKMMIAGFCFVIGGGIGNIYDRILYGSVTDFLQIKLWHLQTGIFNLADLSIMTGVFIIIIHSLFKKNFLRDSREINESMK